MNFFGRGKKGNEKLVYLVQLLFEGLFGSWTIGWVNLRPVDPLPEEQFFGTHVNALTLFDLVGSARGPFEVRLLLVRRSRRRENGTSRTSITSENGGRIVIALSFPQGRTKGEPPFEGEEGNTFLGGTISQRAEHQRSKGRRSFNNQWKYDLTKSGKRKRVVRFEFFWAGLESNLFFLASFDCNTKEKPF